MKKILIIEDNLSELSRVNDALHFSYSEISIIHFSSFIGVNKVLKNNVFDIILFSFSQVSSTKLNKINLIKSYQPSAILIVLSIFDNSETITEMLSLGADGYILQNESYNHLVRLFRDLELGIPAMSPQVLKNLIASLRNKPNKVLSDNLTKRENDVLIQVTKGLSNKEIARILNISSFTVADHIKSLFCKLQLSSRGAVIAYGLNKQQQIH
ncbi:hypothetical protein PULV_b0811 [Pseudoalteromonas ulvae UL12]|uniref:response regulator transcription factor n=1 Tax=Pseudoalteromonas ulvae TaxID=107327 RepID=UPI00186B5D76|nr:response regulator transcription factor [Pseudoalteromonas ulvae]MBE0366072.1 hypothetical protein [Pseudoalteromonas ulvae UL12]